MKMNRKALAYLLMSLPIGNAWSSPSAVPAPTGVTAVSQRDSVSVLWDSNVYGRTFHVYWSDTPGVTKANGNRVTVVAKDVYELKNLQPQKPYYFVVTAEEAGSESAESKEVSAQTDPTHMISVRSRHTLTLLPDGKVLAAGGCPDIEIGEFCEDSLSSTEVFDPATARWSPAAPMNSARAYHTATLLPNGKVLVLGGSQWVFSAPPPETQLASAEWYDPITNTWTTLPPMPAPRSGHSATLLSDGRVLVTGGEDVTTASEIFDPVSVSWTAGPPMVLGYSNSRAATYPDGRVYVVGGSDGGSTPADACEFLDFETPLSWNMCGWAPPYPRESNELETLASGHLLMAGGFRTYCTDGDNCTDNNPVQIFGRGYRWSVGTETGDYGFARVVPLVKGGALVLWGNTWIADDDGSLRDISQPLYPRHRSTSVRLANGQIMFAGGRGQATAEVFDPDSEKWSSPQPDMRRSPRVSWVGIMPNQNLVVRSDGTVLLQVKATDADGAIQRVTFYVNDQPIGAGTASGDIYSMAWAPQGSGTYESWIRAEAEDNSGLISAVPTTAVSVSLPPGPPTFQLTAGDQKAYIHILRYTQSKFSHLYWATDAAGPYQKIANISDEYVLSPLSNGTTYYVRLSAEDSLGEGVQSLVQSVVPGEHTGMIYARQGHQLTRLKDGRILASGGNNEVLGMLASAEIFDPQTAVWHVTGPMPHPHSNHTATLLPDGRVLVVGNGDYWAWQADIFDPSSETWSEAPDLPALVMGHTATVSPTSGKIWFAGGSSQMYGFDASNQSWSLTSFPYWFKAWNYHTSVALGSKLFIIGGLYDNYPSAQNRVASPSTSFYDPETSQAVLPGPGPLNTARSWKGSTGNAQLLPNGKVLIHGGYANPALFPESVASAELFDPVSNVWSYTGSMSTARAQHLSILLNDGRVLAAGGASTNSAELYSPSNGTWSLTAPMKERRLASAGTLMADGRVIVSGGLNDQRALSSVEILDPASGIWSDPAPLSVHVDLSPGNAAASANQTLQFTATVLGSANTAVTWSVQPASGTIDASGLYAAPPAIATTQTVWVRATSVADPRKFATSPVTLLPSSILAITSTDLPEGTVGQNYMAPLNASGGTAPYTWSISAGTLPPSLSISPEGAISGRPDGAPSSFGSYPLTLKVTDSVGAVAFQPVSINIRNTDFDLAVESVGDGQVLLEWGPFVNATAYNVYASTNPDVSPTNAAPMMMTSSSSVTIPGLTNGDTYYFLATPLSGTFEGRPSKAAVAVPTSSLVIFTNRLPRIVNPQMVSIQLQATGGTAPYSWSISSGTLPLGLSLDSTGMLSGGPNILTLSTLFTVQVQDSAGHRATRLMGTTSDELAIGCSSDTGPVQAGAFYSVTCIAIAGTLPFSWTTQGSLPAGLSFSPSWGSSSQLSGIPVNAGSYFYFFTAHAGAAGRSASQRFIGTIAPAPVLVNLSPGNAALSANQTQLFTATVLGSENTMVTWSVDPASGTIDASGLYTAPPAIATTQTVWVKATSVADPTKFATSPVTLVADPVIVIVNVSPGNAALSANQTQHFTATVLGSENTAVTWSVQPASGTIDASGLYTAPAAIATTQTVWIRATSVADPTKFATSPVTLVADPVIVTVNVSPGNAALSANQTQHFTATVLGSENTAVTWSVQPESGTIDASGLYAAPAVIPATQLVRVRATSVADPTKFATAEITLLPTTSAKALPAPTLLLPAVLPIDSQMTATYPAGFSNLAFDWTLTRLNTSNAPLSAHTADPVLNLSSLSGLRAGDYQVTLTATDGISISAAAHGTVRLLLPQLTLNLPSTLPANGQIDLSLPAASPFVSFIWSFQKQTSGQNVLARPAGSPARALSAGYTANSPHLNLSVLNLDPGSYHVSLVAADAEGNQTQPAEGFLTLVATDLSSVKVHPSPWRSDLHSGHDITMDGLPANCTIKIFTVSGRWVKTISNASGHATWDLKNEDGHSVAAGLYIYLVTDDQGHKARGKFGIIR